MTKPDYQVAIVGAGPAGSSAAYWLAKAGISVVLIDKATFPREKVCGDGLIPDSIAMLTQMGCLDAVKAEAKPSSRMLIYSPGGTDVEIDGDFFVLKRERLDHIVYTQACQAGAVPVRASVRTVKQDATGVIVCGENDTPIASAQVALLATGANVGLLRQLGMLERDRASATAIRCYVKSTAKIDKIVVHLLPTSNQYSGAYGWIFPLANGEYNVGCGVGYTANSPQPDLKQMLDAYLTQYAETRALMAQVIAQTPPTAAMLRTGLNGARLLQGRILAIGETIGTTFPMTGEGVGKAMASGKIAAEVAQNALKSNDFNRLVDYENRVRTELEPLYKGYILAEKWVNYPWFCELVFKAARGSDRIRRRMSDVLAEKVDFNDSFSAKNVFKLFWKLLRAYFSPKKPSPSH